jgi:hypothetical protein
MSNGILSQLASVGKADVETVINPEISYWKSKFKRHTQFGLEPKDIEFQGQVNWNRTCTATIARQADLICKLWLVVRLGALDSGNGRAYYTEDIGRAFYDDLKIDVGAVNFDRLYGELEHALEELNECKERQLGMLTGKSSSVTELVEAAKAEQLLYIPLNFWFNNDYGQSLPIVSLHMTEVKVQIKLKKLADVVVAVTGSGYTGPTSGEGDIQMNLMAEYVFLDDPERDWFADNTHKYLISQNQFYGSHTISAGVTEAKVDLTFNHPSKELIFLFRKASNLAAKQYFNFSGEENAPYLDEAFKTMTIKLNGSERFQKRDPLYFRKIQARQHHARIPDKHVYLYSFALFPMDGNPSGSINMSRIDRTTILFEFTTALSENYELLIYDRSINVISINNGSCTVRYA